LAKDLIPIAANKQNVDSQSVFCKNLIDNMLRNYDNFLFELYEVEFEPNFIFIINVQIVIAV
jgi:hypothetical protein